MPSKFDRCVRKVKAAGSAYNPYAVCNKALKHGAREARKATSMVSSGPAYIVGGLLLAGVGVLVYEALKPQTAQAAPVTPPSPSPSPAPTPNPTPTPAPPGTTTPATLSQALATVATDPGLLSTAQGAATALATMANPTITGSTFQQQLQSLQSQQSKLPQNGGQPDYATLGTMIAFYLGQNANSGGGLLQTNTVTDSTEIALAQQVLQSFASKFGTTYTGPVDGNVNNPAFVTAVNAVRQYVNSASQILPTSGVLDFGTWAYIISVAAIS